MHLFIPYYFSLFLRLNWNIQLQYKNENKHIKKKILSVSYIFGWSAFDRQVRDAMYAV